ncbi:MULTISPECIES: polymer-forming cytoskeletal protein [unclassified Burkholderia]|uniref:bactofilin family protein n=1 Tax=unclassified Burkholderia TaxID=2613784 RepID=UPI002AB129C1|nr:MULTISPECIES: polymer-forming cytoskeletal protein [unclassified Burkholderia]
MEDSEELPRQPARVMSMLHRVFPQPGESKAPDDVGAGMSHGVLASSSHELLATRDPDATWATKVAAARQRLVPSSPTGPVAAATQPAGHTVAQPRAAAYQPASAAGAAAPAAVPTSAPPARSAAAAVQGYPDGKEQVALDLVKEGVRAVIPAGMRGMGTLKIDQGGLVFYGEWKGDIEVAGTFIVGRGGVVKGNITARRLIVDGEIGQMSGGERPAIIARDLVITDNGVVCGQMICETFTSGRGARIDGFVQSDL